MTPSSRETYQFDLHARYTALADILTNALPSGDGLRILDVGAGPQRLTEEFLPPGFASVTRTDVEGCDDPDLIRISPGAALPFADGAFDAVVAMDVLEHVQPQDRSLFLQECVRVGKLAVIAAPIGCEAVAKAETQYAEAYRFLFKTTEPFLDEHRDLGLPDPEEVLGILKQTGASVVTVDNLRLADWLGLNVVNLFLSTVNDGDAARSFFSRLHNEQVATAYQDAQHYRRFYICNSDPEVAARLTQRFDPAQLPVPDGRPDAAMLVVADDLKRYVARYHAPTLDAVSANRELAITTLRDVIAEKDRHISELQAVADGLAAQVQVADDLQRASTLDAVSANHELAITTLRDVIAEKDRHITELQAVADGLAAQVQDDALRRQALETERARLDSTLARCDGIAETSRRAFEAAQRLIASQSSAVAEMLQRQAVVVDALERLQAVLERRRERSVRGVVKRLGRRVQSWMHSIGEPRG